MSDFCCISLSQNAVDYRMIMDLVKILIFSDHSVVSACFKVINAFKR